MNKVLVIAAHPDDEILGCGGTMRKHIKNGDKVTVLILSHGISARYSDTNANADEIKEKEDKLLIGANRASSLIGYDLFIEDLPDNQFDTLSLLNIIKIIETWIDSTEPNIIYTHNHSDINIDHRLTFEAVMTATRPCASNVKQIYSFEISSSTEWQSTGLQRFKGNVFSLLDRENIDKKIEALKCYETEMKFYPHPRSIEAVWNKVKTNGSFVLNEFAEVFEAIRIIR